MTIVVTGGAGFIGSNFVELFADTSNEPIIVIDKLTYASSRDTLHKLKQNRQITFYEVDICDHAAITSIIERHQPVKILNFAAETHVDRSIADPSVFLRSNIEGTHCLLEASRQYFETLKRESAENFRFLQISTDEVYGSLSLDSKPFTESSRFEPNSPYAATKASADHLVRAYHKTYGLPTLTSHCSNNFGPRQSPEKLIPLAISKLLSGEQIPVYGDGKNVRDWLYVKDHCIALLAIGDHGKIGSSYNIGGGAEFSNLTLLTKLVASFQQRVVDFPSLSKTLKLGAPEESISFVQDRPGHDFRYAVDHKKISDQLDWHPKYSFDDALEQTVLWYLENIDWFRATHTDQHKAWLEYQYSSK